MTICGPRSSTISPSYNVPVSKIALNPKLEDSSVGRCLSIASPSLHKSPFRGSYEGCLGIYQIITICCEEQNYGKHIVQLTVLHLQLGPKTPPPLGKCSQEGPFGCGDSIFEQRYRSCTGVGSDHYTPNTYAGFFRRETPRTEESQHSAPKTTTIHTHKH